MSNPAKAKGTFWETRIVEWLNHIGFIHAERRALQGANDKGDIAGLPGVVIEAKNHKTILLSSWMKELQVEVDNANAHLGLLCIKKKGSTKPQDCYWLIDPRHVEMVLKTIQGIDD